MKFSNNCRRLATKGAGTVTASFLQLAYEIRKVIIKFGNNEFQKENLICHRDNDRLNPCAKSEELKL